MTKDGKRLEINEHCPHAFCLIRVELDEEGKPCDWTFLSCNENLAKLEGVPKEALIGHRFFEIFPDGSRKWLQPYYEAAYEGKTVSFDDVSEEVDDYLHIEVFPGMEKGTCLCVLRSLTEDLRERARQNDKLKKALKDLEDEERVNAQVRLYASAMGIVYPLAISIDYLKNEYHMIEYEQFLNKSAAWDGTVDELIEVGASTIPNKAFAQKFKNLFSRENALASFRTGKKELSLKHPQVGDDGDVHWMDTKVICLECTDTRAVAISVSKCIDIEKKAEDAYRKLKDREFVLDALSADYDEVYFCDLMTDVLHILKSGNIVSIGTTTQYTTAGRAFYRDRIVPESAPDALEKLSRKNLISYLTTHKELSVRYELKDDPLGRRHFETRFVHTSSDTGFLVVIGIHCIDEIVKEQQEQKEAVDHLNTELHAQLQIFDILSRNFKTAYLLELPSAKIKLLKCEDEHTRQMAKSLPDTFFPYQAIFDVWLPTTVHPEDQAMIREALSPQRVRDRLAENEEYSGNYRRICDGRVENFRFTITRLKDERYAILAFQNIDNIIQSHLKEAAERRAREEAHQKALAKSYEKLESMREIFSATHMGMWNIYFMDGKAPTMDGDDLMKELLGITGKDLTPEEFYDAWFSRIDTEAIPLVTECVENMKKGEKDEVTYLWHHPLWGDIYVRCGGVGRKVDGGIIFSGYHYNVDEAIRKQKAQEDALKDALLTARHATRSKSVFLSNMSHDIRTPMNAIIGFTSLAQTHITNQELVQGYLKKIHTSSTHLLNLINEILDMSLIESGTVKLEEDVVHIPDVLRDLRTMVQGQITARSQHIYVDTVDVLHEDVYTDKLRLNQVLLNITSNAVKYTQNGGTISIRVMEKPGEKEGSTTYVFSVKDNGRGMSPEFVEHVFDSFSRERTSTVSGIQGTGLGMSITKTIVDMMGGTITVESELGKGSEFTVTLPFRVAEGSGADTTITELEGARALVVDDDINTCQSVGKMLREIGMRPDWSTSGREAIIRAREAAKFHEEYKAYIIDYVMPDMNGIETVRQIRKVINKEIPIIVLTAYDWTEFEEEARNAGVTAFASKPLFLSELRKALSRPKEEEAPAEATPSVDYSGRRVLLVEDNELNIEIATTILEEMGLAVDTACDGTEAVTTVFRSDEHRYDLIFMDIQMPKMDGYTATREIRTFKNNTKANIPIIAMTANAFEEDKRKAIEAGMNGHIAKPISIEEITRVLKEILGE